MHGRRVVLGGCVTVLALALMPTSSASAQCLEGTRPLVTVERTFFKDTLGAIRAAMPAAPKGWRIADETEVRVPRGICIGRERQPLSIEFSVRFERVGDDSSAPRVVPAGGGKRAARDARILVTVNAKQELFDPHAERLSMPNVTLALQDGADAPGRTMLGLLIGDWSLFQPADSSESLEAMAHFDTEVVYTRVQSISVKLDGPTEPVTHLVSGLDIDRLKKMLPRVRPSSERRD